MNNVAGLIISVAVLILVIGILVLSFMGLPLVGKYLTTESVKTCGDISRFTQNINDDSAKAEYPVQDIYEACLSTLEVN